MSQEIPERIFSFHKITKDKLAADVLDGIFLGVRRTNKAELIANSEDVKSRARASIGKEAFIIIPSLLLATAITVSPFISIPALLLCVNKLIYLFTLVI